jgi:FkbM family methyltransferase
MASVWQFLGRRLNRSLSEQLEASLERERLFREDFTASVIHQLRQHMDSTFARERLSRQDFSSHLAAQLREYMDQRLASGSSPRIPLVMSPGARIYTHTLDGHRIFLDPNEPYITFHVLENGEWERPTREAIRNLLAPGGCYLDVGANIGLHVLLADMVVGVSGKVIALEPHPISAKLLRDNLEINGMDSRVAAFEAAAAEVDGGARRFELFPEHSSMSGFTIKPERVAARRALQESVEVPLVSLDALVRRLGVAPDLIKIDVEGFELQVLRGATEILSGDHDTAVMIEHAPHLADSLLGDGAADAVIEMFSQNDFVCFLILPGGCQAVSDDDMRNAHGDLLFMRRNSPRIAHLSAPG